jgi:hypothetical protein
MGKHTVVYILVVGIHRQAHRSSIVDPTNVTPRTNLVRNMYEYCKKACSQSALGTAQHSTAQHSMRDHTDQANQA